jgi:hypothetical protein
MPCDAGFVDPDNVVLRERGDHACFAFQGIGDSGIAQRMEVDDLDRPPFAGVTLAGLPDRNGPAAADLTVEIITGNVRELSYGFHDGEP